MKNYYSENLEIILNRDFNNRSRDDAWILASSAGTELNQNQMDLKLQFLK